MPLEEQGNYSLMEVNWGPDYADPETYTDPFARGSNYNFPEYCTETDENGQQPFMKSMKRLSMKQKLSVLISLKGMKLFAKAEAYCNRQSICNPLRTWWRRIHRFKIRSI